MYRTRGCSNYYIFTLFLILFLLTHLDALHLTFDPPDGVFLAKTVEDERVQEAENHNMFPVLVHGCPKQNQIITATHAAFSAKAPLAPIVQGLNESCGLSVLCLDEYIRKSDPQVRVVARSLDHTNPFGNDPTTQMCVSVYVLHQNETVMSSCLLDDSLLQGASISTGAACLISLVLPISWWPSGSGLSRVKQHKLFISLSYSFSYINPNSEICNTDTVEAKGIPQHVNLHSAGEAQLINPEVILEEESIDPLLTALIPKDIQLYAGMILTVPVIFKYSEELINTPLYLFHVRCSVDERLKIVRVESGSSSDWSMGSEISEHGRSATIMIYYHAHIFLNQTWSGEVFTLILKVTTSVSLKWKTNVTWEVRYVLDSNRLLTTNETNGNDSMVNNKQTKSVMQWSVNKDVVMALVPVAQSFELINSAVLTGKQVTLSLKILSVTYAGIISDVTLQSSCVAIEAQVLKVTPSCTAVYLDGSETRGAINSSVIVEFGNQRTLASFTVWYPEFPVQITVTDPVLHSIKGWRLPAWKRLESNEKGDKISRTIEETKSNNKRFKRIIAEQFICRPRYQETQLQVYCRYRVDDVQSGRRSYLGGQGRSLLLDITSMAAYDHIRLTNPSVAKIHHTQAGHLLVQGLNPGKTHIQLMSPLTRVPFGSVDLEVTDETVTVSDMRAVAIAGINISLLAVGTSLPGKHKLLAHIKMQSLFTHKYQEGSVSLSVLYSDGMLSSLEWVEDSEYQLDAWCRNERALVLTKRPIHNASPNNLKSISHMHSSKLVGPDINFLTLEDVSGVMVDFELRAPQGCQNADGRPLLKTNCFVQTRYNDKGRPDRGLYDTLNNRLQSTENVNPHIPLPPVPPSSHKNSDTQSGKEKRNEQTNVEADLPEDEYTAVTHRSMKAEGAVSVSMYIFIGVILIIVSGVLLNCLVQRASIWPNSRYKFTRMVPFNLFRRNEPASTCEDWVWLSRDQINGSVHAKSRPSSSNPLRGAGQGYAPCPRDMMGEDFEFVDDYVDDEPSRASHSSGSHGSAREQLLNPPLPHSQRISYKGSEVSIHISPQPCMEVHTRASTSHRTCPTHGQNQYVAGGLYSTYAYGGHRNGRASSWTTGRNGGHRVRITPNPIVDSSSEQNLSILGPPSPSIPHAYFSHSRNLNRSDNEMRWDSQSLGMSDSQLHHYFSSLRESMA